MERGVKHRLSLADTLPQTSLDALQRVCQTKIEMSSGENLFIVA